MAEFRVGQGVDIHPFVEGRPLYLGGVEIPSAKGLAGHSDADALLHAITDAILGAAGNGDIGSYFPDTDPKWRGARSTIFLKEAAMLAERDGWVIGNLDCTVLAQTPRIAPHIDAMKRAIAGCLSVSPAQCAIKATTTERLGFVGREEGIMAMCVVLLTR